MLYMAHLILKKIYIMLFFVIILAHECSTIQLPLRIYGGTDAMLEEYPYVVRLEKQTSSNSTKNPNPIVTHEHICTASALSAVWLITAAHCLTDKYPYIKIKKKGEKRRFVVIKMVIRYGHVESLPLTKDTFGDVFQTMMHPGYTVDDLVDNLMKAHSRNDIGLVKTSPIKVGSYIKLSAVDYRAVYSHEAVMGGFGLMATKDADGALVIDDTLNLRKPLQVLKVSFKKCTRDKMFLPSLCLAPTCQGETSGCPGDSGGPVLHPSGLLGIIVGGETNPCVDNVSRVVDSGTITPVSPYIEWIYGYISA